MRNSFSNYFQYMVNKKYRFEVNEDLGVYNKMPDDAYLRHKFEMLMGYPLDLDNPRTFNEKLQWLKLHDRRPEYTMMVDKYLVKDYVAGVIGAKHIIPTLGVWDDPDEIDFGALPDQFVLKCNHNSGLGMRICKDKSRLDIKMVKNELRKALRQDYYLLGREWPYKDVPRKIIAEKYMDDTYVNDLRDYKIHCFGGIPMYLQVIGNRNLSNHTGNQMFYTFDWASAGWSFGDYPPYPHELERPENLELMYEFAKRLSVNHTYLRVDLYEINKKVYFGELTFFPGSGLYPYNGIYDQKTDLMLGDWITLSEK